MTVSGTVAPARPLRGRASLWAPVLATAALLGAGGGTLAHVLASRGAQPLGLPELHGQVTWSAGARPAPPLVLRDAAGRTVPLRSLRGRTVVLAVEPSSCGAACASLRGAVASIVRGLAPADRPVVVAVGGPGALVAARPALARRLLAVPPRALLLYLLDRRGDLRTGYLFPFAPAFVQGDLRALAGEGR